MPITTSVAAIEQRDEARSHRWDLRRALWHVSNVKKLQTCGRAAREDGVTLLVTGSGDDRRASAHGLVSCSSIWSCPVCSAHIRQERALEVQAAMDVHRNRNGGALMVTLTLRHDREDGLAELLKALRDSWRAVQQSRRWRREIAELGLVGWIRAIEVTYGENGWHPHLHVLVFTDRPCGFDRRDQLQALAEELWIDRTAKRGFGGLPGIAANVVRVTDDPSSWERIAGYATKGEHSHLELARADLKGGHRPSSYSAWDIVAHAHEGESWALFRWWEYEKAMHGVRAIEWSRDLRDELGIGVERADEEITADQVADETEQVEEVATLTARDWLMLCRTHLDYEAVEAALRGEAAVAAVLDAARLVLDTDIRDQILRHGLRPG